MKVLPQAPLANSATARPTPTPVSTEPAPSEPSDRLEEALPNTREVRVVRFLKQMSRSSLEHLRYLSTIYAWNMVGATVGAIACTPIGVHFANDNPAVVGGTAIGGSVALGGAAALLGYAIERHHGDHHIGESIGAAKPGGLSDKTLSAATTLRALPKFIYPTISGATPQEAQFIYDTLDKLPLKDVTASATINVMEGLGKTGISGMSQPGLSHNRILLDRGYLNRPSFGEELVMHEQGHAVDYSGGYGLVGTFNWRGPFGQGPFISHYAGSNRYEDWAESYHAYHTNREYLQENFPEKFKVIDAAERKTPTEALMDRPAVREAGKKAGAALGAVPYLRTGLELAGAMLSPIQIHRGSQALESGLIRGDQAQKLQGKMNLMSGILLALPGGAPWALATSLTNQGLQTYAGDDPDKLKLANGVANRLLAVTTGPLGMAATALGQELKKSGIDISKVDSETGGFDRKPSAPAVFKGLLSTVGGAVGGSLIGVGVGTSLSGPAGAAMGAFWGRLAGGVLGLGAYGVWRAFKAESASDSPYDLTRGDKAFLAKTVGGALVGGTAGTILGSTAGSTVGQALGSALGGPSGAVLGSTLGTVAGVLGGSYTLARAGAWAGRKWAGEEPPQTTGEPK